MTDSKYGYKNIWKIAYPIILGSLAQDLITIIDTIFVGKLGEVALGAAAIGGIFYLSIIMLGWGFGIGVQIIVARRLGENKIEDISKTLFHSFLILFTLAFLVFIGIKLFSLSIFNQILDSTAIVREAQSFIQIRMFGIFAAFTNIIFRSFYIGTANTKIISRSTILMAVVNICLDYLLIFGHGIISPMGIKGAALASVIAEFVALIYFYIQTKRNNELRHYKLFSLHKWQSSIVKSVLSIATPTMLQNFISFSSWFVFFVFVEKMGETPLAISNIIRSIYIVLLLPIMGFASATNTLVSYSLGKKESAYIKQVVLRSLFMAFIGITIIVFLSALFPKSIIGLFTQSIDMIEATLPAYKVVMKASFTLAFGMILFQAVSGTGNTKSALLIEITIIAIYLGSIYWLVENTNQTVEQIWKMEYVYGLGLGLLSLAYMFFGKWSERKI